MSEKKENEMKEIADALNSEIDINDVFQGLDKPLRLEDIVLKPNANTLEEIVDIVNEKRSPNAFQSIFGKLIDPGKVGIIDYNGTVQLIGPGRWVLPNPRAELKRIASLAENVITYESLTIVRVQRGDLGLASDNGQPIILGEGIHVRNIRLFEFDKCVNVNKQYLKHMSLHIIRVPRGHYGLVTENTIPKLLPEGIHVVNSNLFTFDGVQLINQPYVNHGTLHILRIPKGSVALVSDNNKPKLLEGTHCINSKTFTFVKMEALQQTCIHHGTITRFVVKKGEVGLAWENNNPVFYEEGVYMKDSPFFVFDRCISASEKQITLGAKKIVTVYDGEVGLSYLRGKLVVLTPNRHFIDSADHIFQGFLSTQQQCLHLYTKGAERKAASANSKSTAKKTSEEEDGLLICETKDFVEIGLRADVFYQIDQPEKALLVVGKDNIATLVRDTATATLNSIIRSTSLAEVAQNKEIAAKSTKQHYEQNPAAPLFFDKVHDEFISKLHDNFLDHYGINVTNIRIESFKIMNQELAQNISQQAFVTAQTQNQLANLTGQTEIATAQQRRDAEVARIRAEGEAIKLTTETNANNRAVMESAKAEAEAQVLKAKAEAQAIEVRAQADAKAAESKRAEMLNSTALGGQLQMYAIYSDMVKASMEGIQKVVYMPGGGDSGSNPLSFLAFQQGVIPGVMSTQAQSTAMTKKPHA